MRQGILIFGTVAGLLMSAGAAAADFTQDDQVAPGLYFRMSFGAAPAALSAPASLQQGAFTLNETTGPESTGLSTGTWVAIGLAAAVVVIVVASNHGGGSNGSGGGY